MLLRAKAAATAAVALVLCLAFTCCQRTESITVPADNPANGTLSKSDKDKFGASSNVAFGSSGNLDPSSPVGAANSIPSSSRYWIKTGDSIDISWNAYNLDISCPDNGGMPGAPPTIPLNLCSPKCLNGAQPKGCVFTQRAAQYPNSPDLVPLPDSIGSCPDWPANHEIVLVPAPGTAFVSDDPNPSVHLVGPASNLNVWVQQFPCVDEMCASLGSPTLAPPSLWAAGCSPNAVSFTPSLDNMANRDVRLQLWASSRTDFAQTPPQQSGDQQGPMLDVSGVSTGSPRVDTRRVLFTEECGPGPGMSSCDNQDSTQSQWCSNPSAAGCSPMLDEVFSAQLRVKEIRVFAAPDPTNLQEFAFCSAFLAGQGDTSAPSDCDKSLVPAQVDCKASPRATPPQQAINSSPGDTWKITFSDQMNGASGLRCPNDSNRTQVWVEFKLEAYR